MSKTISNERQKQLVDLATVIKLPVPRIESRNFISQELNKVTLVNEYKVETYLGLVLDTLMDGLSFVNLDRSTAFLPLVADPSLYVGFRRKGDMFNLMSQLNLPAFIVDEDGSFEELIMKTEDLPGALFNKPYFKKK